MTLNPVQNGSNGHEEVPDEVKERLVVEYENRSQKFILPVKHDYNKQFHNLYVARCEAMLVFLREKIAAKWGTQYPIRKIHDLNEENQEKCVIIGTVFKQQVLKPSVLKELAKVTHIMPQPIAPSFTDDSDTVMLEDELQRVRLFGNIVPHDLVTGIMCAVLGVASHILEQGRFHVDEVLFYDSGPQKSLKTLTNDPCIVLISGLNMTQADNLTMPLELFQQWLYGNWSGMWNNFDPQNVVRVIMAGNSVKNEDNRAETLDLEQQATTDDVNGVKALDNLLEQLSQSVDVDVMPGEYDPTSSLLPQQPIHMLLLPKCSQLKACQSVPNPYFCDVAGRSILGMSGQNVDDIMRYSKITDALSALKATIRWGHMVPTCPDTQFAYPMLGKDPFIIDECPHIYFTGNCPEYQTELLEDATGRKIRLICVPKFYETKSVVMVNLVNLECKLMVFQSE